MRSLKTFKSLAGFRTFLFVLLLMLGLGTSSTVKAAPYNEGSGCYFTVNGTNYIKFSINNATWGNITNTAGTVGTVYVTVKLYDASSNLIGTYTSPANSQTMYVNVGSVSGPYHVEAYIEVIQSGTAIMHVDLGDPGSNGIIEITNQCNDVEQPNGHVDGCFTSYQNETGSGTLVKVTLDPSFQLFMAFHNYHPVLFITDGPTVIYGAFPATTTAGNVLTFNISSTANLDPDKCFDSYIYFENQNNVLQQDYEYPFRICLCDPSRNCAADFKIEAADFGGGYFGMQCGTGNVGNIASEYWTISSGPTVVWSGPLALGWLLPYGGYTICHKVTTIYGETCEYCTDYCFTGNTKSNVLGDGGGGKNKTAKPTGTKQAATGKTTLVKDGDQLRINYYAADDAHVNIAVYNSLGQVIMKENNIGVQKGANNIVEKLPSVNSGVYYMQITGNNKSVTNKFTVD